MAGYSKIYCIGGEGGFQGADGIMPMILQIWQGEADRRWFEAHYFDDSAESISEIRRLIPEAPGDPDALLDACIAFYPQHFEQCSSLETVKEKLTGVERLDFDQRKEEIPSEWYDLREEAREAFKSLKVWEAELSQI